MIQKTCLSIDCPERTGGECNAYADVPMSPRTEESELKYQVAKVLKETIPLDKEPRLLQWEYWYLISNRFPYDMIYEEHDMLVPYSGTANREDLSMAETIELANIIEEMSNQYDLVFENFSHRRSIISVYHVHLARYYKNRLQVKL